MVALEDQAAALMQKHARLAAENAALRRRHQALELSIAGREEHVNLLAQMSSLTIDNMAPLADSAGVELAEQTDTATMASSQWAVPDRLPCPPHQHSRPAPGGLREQNFFINHHHHHHHHHQQQQQQHAWVQLPEPQPLLQPCAPLLSRTPAINRSISMPARAVISSSIQGLPHETHAVVQRSSSAPQQSGLPMPPSWPAVVCDEPLGLTLAEKQDKIKEEAEMKRPAMMEPCQRPHSWSGTGIPATSSASATLLQRSAQSFPSIGTTTATTTTTTTTGSPTPHQQQEEVLWNDCLFSQSAAQLTSSALPPQHLGWLTAAQQTDGFAARRAAFATVTTSGPAAAVAPSMQRWASEVVPSCALPPARHAFSLTQQTTPDQSSAGALGSRPAMRLQGRGDAEHAAPVDAAIDDSGVQMLQQWQLPASSPLLPRSLLVTEAPVAMASVLLPPLQPSPPSAEPFMPAQCAGELLPQCAAQGDVSQSQDGGHAPAAGVFPQAPAAVAAAAHDNEEEEEEEEGPLQIQELVAWYRWAHSPPGSILIIMPTQSHCPSLHEYLSLPAPPLAFARNQLHVHRCTASMQGRPATACTAAAACRAAAARCGCRRYTHHRSGAVDAGCAPVCCS
jgi:hypothetical protein